MKHLILIISFFVILASANAQEYFKIDSLEKEAKKALAKDKAKFYNEISWKLRNTNPKSAVEYGKKAVELSKKHKKYTELSKAYSFTGVAYRNAGNFEQALAYYEMCLETAQRYQLTEQEGYANINFANWYIYSGENRLALEYLAKAEKIAEKLKHKEMSAYCKLNIGRVYIAFQENDKAMEYLTKALDIRKELNNKFGQSVCYKYIADTYRQKGEFSLALEQYNKAFETADRKFDKDLMADIYDKRAKIYLSLGQTYKSEQQAKTGLEHSLQTKSPVRIRAAYETLSNIYKAKNNNKKALKYQELAKLYTDSLYLRQLNDKITNIEFKNNQDVNDAIISNLKKEKQLQKSVLKEEKTRKWALVAASLLILVLVISFYINYQQKQSALEVEEQKNKLISRQHSELSQSNEEITTQRDAIELQKNAIEKQQKQIKDSIKYAEKIQKATFTKMSDIKKLIPYQFILFIPRDIVSGDFYYVKKIGKHLIIGAADCTGHGVPGAFVSMLGMSLLNEITENKEIVSPELILEELRKNIKSSLQQSQSNNSQNDGMDLALSVINTKTLELEFAGANNPLYIIRNQELIELLPNLNPVGFFFREKPFKKETFQLHKDDSFYIFSDGYADQFGGKKDRKFTTRRLKETLLSIQKYPMSMQKNLLKKQFYSWKGNGRQIDDVLIIGIKVADLT